MALRAQEERIEQERTACARARLFAAPRCRANPVPVARSGREERQEERACTLSSCLKGRLRQTGLTGRCSSPPRAAHFASFALDHGAGLVMPRQTFECQRWWRPCNRPSSWPKRALQLGAQANTRFFKDKRGFGKKCPGSVLSSPFQELCCQVRSPAAGTGTGTRSSTFCRRRPQRPNKVGPAPAQAGLFQWH